MYLGTVIGRGEVEAATISGRCHRNEYLAANAAEVLLQNGARSCDCDQVRNSPPFHMTAQAALEYSAKPSVQLDTFGFHLLKRKVYLWWKRQMVQPPEIVCDLGNVETRTPGKIDGSSANCAWV